MTTCAWMRRLSLPPLTLSCLAAISVADAHHSSQAEFGPFGSPTSYVEAKIERINWGNPHISMDLTITGGALPVGRALAAREPPVRIMEEYGFKQATSRSATR